MMRRSSQASSASIASALRAAPGGKEPLDPDLLRVIQALARADEDADYRASQMPPEPKAA